MNYCQAHSINPELCIICKMYGCMCEEAEKMINDVREERRR
jgi:hypothetical protein